MAICVFWLLTYVGLGLALALGNRPVSNAQGTTHRQDYRRGNNVRKMGELNSVDSNLLHLRAYPYEESHRDHLSDWVVLNDEPTSASSSQFLTNVLIDGLSNDPRALQTLFFALSPTTILDVMYPDYSLGGQAAEPFLYDEASLIEQHHRLRKHQRLNYKPSRRVIDLPILVYESADKASSESRQSNFDDLFEQRLTTATTLKTDLIFERTDSSSRELQNNNGLVSKPLVYEMSKIPGKRNQMSVGRRSIESEGTSATHQGQTSTGTSSSSSSSSSGGGSIASQFMMRSVRGNKQYDVPQIECPASDDGMERFACPTADRMGRYRCIDDHVLCDGFIDCPTGEDEDRHACMFYKTTKAHLDVLADALLRWARGR